MITPEQRLLVWIFYKTPFRKVADWMWKVGLPEAPENEVADGSLRDRIASVFDLLDTWYLNRYLRKGQMPPKRWRTSRGR